MQAIDRPVDKIPVYREGGSDNESVQRFQDDPIRFHLRAFRQLGPIYATYFRKRMWVVLAGLEANDFVWRNWKIWDYSNANAPFLDEMGPDHVTALDGDHHRDKRTILKPAFDQAPATRFLPEFHRLLENELQSVGNRRVEFTKFWARSSRRLTVERSLVRRFRPMSSSEWRNTKCCEASSWTIAERPISSANGIAL